MGAYLIFRLADTTPGHAKKVNQWLSEQPEYNKLKHGECDRSFRFWDEDDVQWAIEEIGEEAAEGTDKTAEEVGRDYREVGECRLKTSGLGLGEKEWATELWTSLFDKLHDEFEVEVYSKSCSLHPAHFTTEQVATITDNGDALTGDYDSLTDLFVAVGFEQTPA